MQSKLTGQQWSDIVTNGAALNNAWKAEPDIIVPYLQQLKDAGVPVLWRPLHEIDDSWSWWGGAANSARLYQITHDYLVGAKGLTNLIWTWAVKDDATSTVGAYYPGSQYVDIVGLDSWNNNFPSTSWYQILQSFGKPIALSEVGQLPTPAELSAQPNWTYFSDWAEYLTNSNTNAQVQATYYDPRVLHRGAINLSAGGGTGQITGYGLDDTGRSTTPGTQVQIWDCTGNANQHWNIP